MVNLSLNIILSFLMIGKFYGKNGIIMLINLVVLIVDINLCKCWKMVNYCFIFKLGIYICIIF